MFGGNNASTATQAAIDADSMACAFVGKDLFWRQNVELEKELGVQRYDNLKANYELYVNLDNKISGLQAKNAALEASLPLAMQLAAVNAERYADNKVQTAVAEQTGYNFLIQRELDKKINGTMGLPFGDIITGVPTLPNLTYCVGGCNGCGGSSSTPS